MESTTLFAGCSYTAGQGFARSKEEPALWVNLLHRNTPELAQTKLLNIAQRGRCNERIFQGSVSQISRGNIKYAFIVWSELLRHEFDLGCEEYTTHCVFTANNTLFDYNINGVTYTKQYLESIRDRFISLHDYHYEILKIVDYVNILTRIAKQFNTQIFFINGLCEWDSEYFTYDPNPLSSDYTPFTQKLLHVDNRDDSEISRLYTKIHSEYASLGGIHKEQWINLYQSLRELRIDRNSDGDHPGIKSNQAYYELIRSRIHHHHKL